MYILLTERFPTEADALWSYRYGHENHYQRCWFSCYDGVDSVVDRHCAARSVGILQELITITRTPRGTICIP